MSYRWRFMQINPLIYAHNTIYISSMRKRSFQFLKTKREKDYNNIKNRELFLVGIKLTEKESHFK